MQQKWHKPGIQVTTHKPCTN